MFTLSLGEEKMVIVSHFTPSLHTQTKGAGGRVISESNK